MVTEEPLRSTISISRVLEVNNLIGSDLAQSTMGPDTNVMPGNDPVKSGSTE